MAIDKNKKYKIIISGGGTGGHIYPAIAVAQALQNTLPNVELLFVGAKDKMEMEKVPKAGYKIIGLWISGLQRSLSFKNLLFPFKVIYSIVSSLNIIKTFKPDAVVGFGGYASGAMLYAATIKKIPTVIHEQNSFAGITNKILKNRVDTICVAYDNMERFFPKRKLVKTGNPIRQDLTQSDLQKNKAAEFFKLSIHKPTVLVLGGSLGAKSINECIDERLDEFEKNNYQIIWQTGKNYIPKNSIANSSVHQFIYEMGLAYTMADVVISRAGALTIAELAVVKKPIILVPSPNVAEDHQTKNAMALVNIDAAILIKDNEAKAQLVDSCFNLINNPSKQVQLKNNIATFAFNHAAEQIVNQITRAISS